MEVTTVTTPRGPAARVAETVLGGPADFAGIVAGDRIVSVAGQPVTTSLSVRQRIEHLPPGRVIKIVVLRSGRSRTLLVHLGYAPV
jgi:S1-C subfamily serine protease